MIWTTTHSVEAFEAAAGDLLRARRAESTIILTTLETLRAGGSEAYGGAEPRFGWCSGPDGRVAAAFLHTPPYPVVLTDLPADAVPSLVETLGPVDRINADRRSADAVAHEWRRQRGGDVEVDLRHRLYRLERLIPPDPAPPGRPRRAGVADRDLLLRWLRMFERELGDESPNPAAAVDDRISYGGLSLWEVDGEPVSMAGWTRPAAGMLRIGPVFTPVELRGRGYASAVTDAVSRAAQDLVDEVLLFTDLANPTSNRIYQRLGYRPVADRVVLAGHVGVGGTDG